MRGQGAEQHHDEQQRLHPRQEADGRRHEEGGSRSPWWHDDVFDALVFYAGFSRRAVIFARFCSYYNEYEDSTLGIRQIYAVA